VPGSRLEQAKRAALDLADAVQRRGGHRVGLVAVAASAKVVCPLTQDVDHFRDAVADLDVAELARELGPRAGARSGTRLGTGLVVAVQTLDEPHRRGQTVVLLSDGDDPGADGEWAAGVHTARTEGVVVHTVGIGDPERDRPLPGLAASSRLVEEPLRAIAAETGGEYVPARTAPPPLARLFRERIEPGPTRDAGDDAVTTYRQRYRPFLAAALGLLALGMVSLGGVPARGRRNNGDDRAMKRRGWWPLPFLLLLSAAPAVEPLAAVRQGNDAFAAGDYAAALHWYRQAEADTPDPGLVAINTATALAHLGRYREAELHYRCCLDDMDLSRRARAWYGLGTCQLRRSGGSDRPLLAAAISNLAQCLRLDPEPGLAADARINRELAKRLLLLSQATNPATGPDTPPEPPSGPEKDPTTTTSTDPRPTTGDVKPEVGKPDPGTQQRPVPVDVPPPPGAGNLPPIPDTADGPPIPAADAAALLQQAAERVRSERRQYLTEPRPPRPNVKDW
jgi:tetratricopeptide (TPR) repeat protein